MRLRSLFIILVVFFFIISLGSSIFYLFVSEQASFKNQVEDYLNSVIDVNEERINDFVDEIEGDILFLVESNSAHDILKKDLEKSRTAAKLGVGDKAKVIAQEVDNYLKAHPDMTLKELQASKEFQDIAVQDIGNNGYSGIIGSESAVIYFHVDSYVVGKNIEDVSIDKILVDIIDEARYTGFGSGFYTWANANAVSREKYLEAGSVGQRTADGFKLMAVATVYVDDYLVAKDVSDRISENLERFSKNRDYSHILFVSPDDLIVYMTNPMEGIGVNIFATDIGIANMRFNIDEMNRGDVIFYGPFIGHKNMAGLQIASASGIYEGDKFLGSIILIKNIEKLEDILEEETFFGEKDEDYLIDRNGLLITSLRTRDVDILVQEVRTTSSEECLEDFDKADSFEMTVKEYHAFEKQENLEPVLYPFQNFEGDLTYGLHRPIDKANWCLLSEVGADEVLSKPVKESFWEHVVFRLWVFVYVFIVAIFASFFIDRKYILKKRKISPSFLIKFFGNKS